MAIFNFNKRSKSANNPVGVTALTINASGPLNLPGYHHLMDAPEVASAIWLIADLISTMPIHLMENAAGGDIRIKDQLSRKIDISPWKNGTRMDWMQWIVATMLVNGEAVVIPKITGLLIDDLYPAPGASVYRPSGCQGYYINYNGHQFDADNVLHFKLRPNPDQPWRGEGVQIQLQQVVDSIIQTAETKTAYMSSEYKPPIVIAVNSDSPLSDETARKKFINKYLKRTDKSEPLIIPADLMNISQAKPLSLTDLAIKDGVELDKKTVAAIIDVPAFLLGVGSFNRDEYNAWISRRLLKICRGIEQELTKKLLTSDTRYWRMNARALYSYSLTELSQIALNMRNAGLMSGNEGRNWMDLPPRKGLDDLVMLENFIPADRLGDQSKLNNQTQKEDSEDV